MDYLLCVNPDKLDFFLICYRVINNLYLTVLFNLINIKKTTAFKYNLFWKFVFYKYFKHIHGYSQNFDNNVI